MPNCKRATCYGALSLNYDVVIVENATPSRTPEVQRASIADMGYIAARIATAQEFVVGCGQTCAQASHAHFFRPVFRSF